MTELQHLSESGMSIGAHTQTHPMLSRLPEELAWREISSNKEDLEKSLGKPVWALAYPFGAADSVTSREEEMAERAGFTCAFLNCGGRGNERNSLFALPRVHITSDMRLSEFEAHISGLYQSLRSRFFTKPTPIERALATETGINVRRA
jgi:peptidoglycan/xylan/chitin deacetylase (PgdA/CDA1 family)